jgi:hypothetical protein
MHRNDNLRLMRESVVLTKEINELRRELKVMHQERAGQTIAAEDSGWGPSPPMAPPGRSKRKGSFKGSKRVQRTGDASIDSMGSPSERTRMQQEEADAEADVSALNCRNVHKTTYPQLFLTMILIRI